MKKIFILLITLLLISCVWAQTNSNININGVNFEIPSKYQDGEVKNDRYDLEDTFTIQCIDDNIPKHIGLWACEKDYGENLTINKHPVRYYYQYNPYVNDNQSHAYFASNDSIFEIVWKGNTINNDVEKIIKNSPQPKIDEDAFNYVLDKSIEIYKSQRIDQLNKDGEYNYLEGKYNSKMQNANHDDTRLKEILLTYYR